MKVAAIVISICFTCLLTIISCSNDEPPSYPENKDVIRQAINKPVQEKSEPLTTTQNITSEPELKEEVKEAETIEVGINDEEPPTLIEEDESIYVTHEGDSLSAIAGREDVYGNSSKWPILYRLNREKLHQLLKDSDLPDRELPKGTILDIITLDEVKENLKNRPKNYWVINVVSSPQMDRIVPPVLNLIDNGYPAYITVVKVKGKDWIRIRVGFFEDKKTAEKEGEKIIATLKISDIWTTKVGDIERGEFGGY
jgi:hypothetical protein